MNNYTTQPHTKGAAVLLFMLFFVMGSVALTLAFSRSFYSDLFTYQLLQSSAASYYAAESGIEDVAYRLIAGLDVDAEETITLNAATATTTNVFVSADDRFDIQAAGEYRNTYKTSAVSLYAGVGASFNFGVQTGNGGFALTNGSSVQGNVFSNGNITKSGGGNAWIYGDAITAGATGQIHAARISGTARANHLQDAYVQGNAYYNSDSGSTVLGTRYTPVTPEVPTEMPISDETIDAIKQDIVDNGTVITAADPLCAGGEYLINTDTTLGFVKIECNLRIKKQTSETILTLTGPLWVTGNIYFEAGPTVQVDAVVGNRTVPFIADNEADRVTSGLVTIESGTKFYGSGDPKSYVLLISQNSDAELGGSNVAITLGQSSAGDLLVYASHGLVSLGNSVSLKEVTGYQIYLGNNAEIIYESGLVNLLFTSGPGGGFTFNNWRESM